MSIKLLGGSAAYESQPLNRPFGVKGGYIRDLWQVVVGLESASGCRCTGIGTQNVFRGDRRVFRENKQEGGNQRMFELTDYAVKLCQGRSFQTPVDLMEQLLEPTWNYGRQITGHPDLSQAFVLNALEPLDIAAWRVYAAENGIQSFDELIPPEYRCMFCEHHREVACIPTLTHDIPLEEIILHADKDYFFLKLKMAYMSDRDRNPDKMLEWDMERIKGVMQVLEDYEVPYTDSGKILFYLDMGGRYPNKDYLHKFLDFCDRIGAREQIAMIEEPFPEDYQVRVDDLGVRLAVASYVQNDLDVARRCAMGYGAVILNPAAKTLSMSLKMGKVAAIAGIPMICSDFMVEPIQVDLNKNVAARLKCFPGVKVGLQETNGHRLYKNWEDLRSFYPHGFKGWTEIRGGGFHLDDYFFSCNGGAFDESKHYRKLVFAE